MTTNMKGIVEALLFAAENPLSLFQIAQILETDDTEKVREIVLSLKEDYKGLGRSVLLVEVAGGYCFRTRPEYSYWLRRLKKQQVTRLSRAALETLAIIAYKQPTLKAEIERLRGVEVGGVLRMLMEKDLIRVVGRKELPGRPLIYGTTRRFLEVFGLNDLKDLPTLEEMETVLGGGVVDVDESVQQDQTPLFPSSQALSENKADEAGGGMESDNGGEPQAA